MQGLPPQILFIVGQKGIFLPLTINHQIIDFQDERMSYQGGQIPNKTPHADEI